MKKILLVVSVVLFSLQSFSQCGVTPDILPTAGTQSAGLVFRANATLQPNWIVTGYEWRVNDNPFPVSTLQDYNFNYVNPFIFRLCLKINVMDTISSNTCSQEICNIFNSSFPEHSNIDIWYESGLYFQLMLTRIDSYSQSGNTGYAVDFGDGTVVTGSTSIYAVEAHTYAAPGNYVVQFNSGWDSGSRTIHVGNGSSNLTSLSGNYPNVLNGCNTSITQPYSIPPYLNAWVDIIGSPVYGSGNINNNPVPYNQYINSEFFIPGQNLLRIDYMDSAFNHIYIYHSVIIDDACIPPPDTIFGTVWNDINFNGIQDVGENGLLNASISAFNYSAKSDSLGNYSILVPHIQTSIDVALAGYIKSFPQGAYTFNFLNGTGHYNYNFGLAPLNQICGKTFIDNNIDSIFTSGIDANIANATLSFHDSITSNNFYTTTDNNGNYCISLPYGNYMIKPVSYLLDSAIIFPDSISLLLSAPIFTDQNFAFHSNFSGGNFHTTISSNHLPHIGFDYAISIRLENSGMDSLTGVLSFNYDDTLTILNISPANGTVDTANHTITWNTGYVHQSSVKYFTAGFNVPFSIPLGYVLSSVATVNSIPATADHDTTNNTTTFFQAAVASFDPNDKSVCPNGYGNSGDVHHETRLNYRINFQNTGTASAINIIVQDTIDSDLDMNTFLMQRASHPYSIVINGNIIAWKFSNINLPDSNSNEPLSHGFIEYSIKPKQGLPDGTPIENNAQIYFDFISPVSTNTTLNTLQTLITSLPDNVIENSISISPNPTNGNFKINYHTQNSNQIKLEIFDIAGEKVYSKNLPQEKTSQTISLPNFSSGVYAVKINAENFSESKKLVIIK